ncbi:hypothetical protein FPQ18DRAFT_337513 [Pyronema domesticum]|nr:hypothetical protein FPQ18DRAFT_337513 [Pyronema domesticum]
MGNMFTLLRFSATLILLSAELFVLKKHLQYQSTKQPLQSQLSSSKCNSTPSFSASTVYAASNIFPFHHYSPIFT